MPKSFKPPKAPVGTININTASAAELALLPGVGPAMAARIIEYRQKSGGFKAVDEIDRVRGVGPKTLEKLRPHLRISDEGTPQSPLPPG